MDESSDACSPESLARLKSDADTHMSIAEALYDYATRHEKEANRLRTKYESLLAQSSSGGMTVSSRRPRHRE